VNFRSKLSLFATGVELRSELGETDGRRERLLANKLQHVSMVQQPRRIPPRPLLAGSRQYLRALRAAEMEAWEAGLRLDLIQQDTAE
jgi:hypothetical protein